MTREFLEQGIETLHPASFGWAMACCGWDREEAEDVLQEAYVRVLDGRARFDGRSSLKTWLFGVIRRTARGRRRGKWLRALALGRWTNGQPAPSSPRSPEALTGESETRRVLREALEALPGRQRDLLHLVFYQDLTVDEAASVLGISEGAARTHYHRGKDQLRRTLLPETRP